MKAADTAATGVVLGFVVAFFAALAVTASSAITQAPAALPFVLAAQVGRENGMPSVELFPNWTGLLALIGMVAIGYIIARARRTKRGPS